MLSEDVMEYKITHMMKPDVVGVELIRRGWHQGSLLKAASAQKSWLVLNASEEVLHQNTPSTSTSTSSSFWTLQQEMLDQHDFLIIISHTCDIQKPLRQEPYVEVIRAYWTSERSIMHEASKNSVRRFLMQRRIPDNGKEEALIADATPHLQIEKVALLKLIPLASFRENDKVTPRRFRQWLARRYDRPALPDTLVEAVQKPIVKAIDKLKETDDCHRILDDISQIRFLPQNNDIPYQVDMLFMRDERPDAPTVSEEDAAKLAGWISDVLKKAGSASLADWEILSTEEISVRTYTNTFELPLDYYSLAQGDSTDN